MKVLLHGNEIRDLELSSGREYTFGRGSNCDVQLEEQSGISRTHFKLLEENNQWTVQVLAKFGDIHFGGSPVQSLTLEPGAVFKVGPFDFQYLEQRAEENAAHIDPESMPVKLESSVVAISGGVSGGFSGGQMRQAAGAEMPNNGSGGTGSGLQSEPELFDGNEDATQIFAALPEVPYVRIQNFGQQETTIRLQGRKWLAGREETCDLQLDDRKASRRQFELSSTPQGYFVRDLGSSNGTQLNGVQLGNDELKPIRSGDTLQVGNCIVHFEIRDPNFDKKLMIVPPEVRVGNPIVEQNPYVMINYPVPMSGGGAVVLNPRVDRNGQLMPIGPDGSIQRKNLAGDRRKKIRIWLAVAAGLFLVLGYFSMNSQPPPQKKAAKTNEAFNKLSPRDQENVKELFAVAYNLYMQQKLALSAEQLQKLHKLIPEGYENSLAMAQECAQQSELERQLRELEDQKRKQEEIRRTVEKTIADCDPLSKRAKTTDEITRCLEAALNLDPENPKIHEQIDRVQQRIDMARMADQQQRDYQGRVAKGKALYDKAFNLEVAGEFLDAIDAYKKHMNSSYPDPQNLKSLSAKQSLDIQKRMSARIDDAIKGAEAAYAVGNFREAIDDLKSAKKIDPKNAHAAELLGKYRRELDLKMREIYEDAVVSEGLGNVEGSNGAKFLWKKILDTDHPDGEYFKKSKNKMKAYGS